MIKFEDWQDYLDRSGDPYKRIYPAEHILSSDYGFVSYDINIQDGFILIHQMYGNGKHWIEHLKATAKRYHIKEIRFFTTRNPKAIERKYGAKVLGTTMTMEVD